MLDWLEALKLALVPSVLLSNFIGTAVGIVIGALPGLTSTMEPTPDPEIPAAPPHLSPEAREEWDRLALELYELGILSTIDRAALAASLSVWLSLIRV